MRDARAAEAAHGGGAEARECLAGAGRAPAQEAANKLGIGLLFLPGYSPNLNPIGRLWRFIKREALRGRYRPTFADFEAAIERTTAELGSTREEALESLLTLNFQTFDDVSLLAA